MFHVSKSILKKIMAESGIKCAAKHSVVFATIFSTGGSSLTGDRKCPALYSPIDLAKSE